MSTASSEHVLLICYSFPPYSGVGGRRWAKFAKYLTRSGFTVHVICAESRSGERSLWDMDVNDNPGIIRYPLPALYPRILQIRPSTLMQKLGYALWTRILPLFSRGTIYDKALFWKSRLLRKARAIIREKNIRNVIVTGAPFNLTYFTSILKLQDPSLKIITDLRDPWTWGSAYGYGSLSDRRKKFETEKEAQVMALSDYITVPVQAMADHLKRLYPALASKIILLPHAFDEEEVRAYEKRPDKRLRLVFFGSIYDHLETYMQDLCEVLDKNREMVRLDFYADSDKYSEIVSAYKLEGTVNYHSPLNGKELFRRFAEYDYVLLIYPDYATNYLTTKFFEIIESRTPILYIGNHGYTAEFITQNKIGIYLPPAEIKKGIQKLIENKKMEDYNYSYDNSGFSFSSVCGQLIGLLR